MIKTLKTMSKQDKERYTVPRKVQDVISSATSIIWWQAARIKRVCSSSTRSFSTPWILER